ncbi:sulfatase family protein [Mucilaginibacter agri]|uniref:Sulfatase-like hydrolase/transferase n=1 Tax=Mucilaginibacter agri TaxID=2695265 RepID=A0A965ZEL0_9SPHI|nr:sulfatase [Mucilaginibacter agri]NCD69634.1 sulfatase-like hydrolase/transferase [Mucilaginibacter agri]
MRKMFVVIWAVLLTLGAIAQSKKPNVIVILMDDMGYGDTEPYGMTGIPTPNFNRLTKEGTRFTHYNAAEPICTASRAAFLTGCYSNRIGMTGAMLPGDKRALNPDEETIASLLKQDGYQTAMFGKWHLGNKAPFWPTHYGFDTFYGIPYSHDIWNRDHEGNLITDKNDIRYSWPPLPLIEGDRVVDSITSKQKLSELCSTLTERSVKFIKQNKSKPFFLYLAHTMPHVPLAPSVRFQGKSELGPFGDEIMELDWSIGQILKTLREEKLADNTILIVTSDNGPWLNYGDNAGSSGGFREGKSTTWEGGTRVPFWLIWPSKVAAGGINSMLMTNMDLLPTIVAATGARLPKKQIDGVNFLPVWLGKIQTDPREVFFYYFGKNNLEGVRYKNWKLVLPHLSGTYTGLHGKNGNGGPIGKVNVPMALYDLAHDPGEAYDVQQLYPEMVRKLTGFAELARKDMGDDLTGNPGKNRRTTAIAD